jgi:organic hydroperoxide reductase OsmC/OhrA
VVGVSQPLPHRYTVRAAGTTSGSVSVLASGLPAIETQPPPEFGGPEGYWSPETLLLASVADCFILSFRAVARASRLEWSEMDVGVQGVLDRVDGVTRFIQVRIAPRLGVPGSTPESTALAVLEKAKRACLVTNSLNSICELAPLVYSVAAPADAD